MPVIPTFAASLVGSCVGMIQRKEPLAIEETTTLCLSGPRAGRTFCKSEAVKPIIPLGLPTRLWPKLWKLPAASGEILQAQFSGRSGRRPGHFPLDGGPKN